MASRSFYVNRHLDNLRAAKKCRDCKRNSTRSRCKRCRRKHADAEAARYGMRALGLTPAKEPTS